MTSDEVKQFASNLWDYAIKGKMDGSINIPEDVEVTVKGMTWDTDNISEGKEMKIDLTIELSKKEEQMLND